MSTVGPRGPIRLSWDEPAPGDLMDTLVADAEDDEPTPRRHPEGLPMSSLSRTLVHTARIETVLELLGAGQFDDSSAPTDPARLAGALAALCIDAPATYPRGKTGRGYGLPPINPLERYADDVLAARRTVERLLDLGTGHPDLNHTRGVSRLATLERALEDARDELDRLVRASLPDPE